MHRLAVTEQGVSLRAEGEMLSIRRGRHEIQRVRVGELEQVLLFGKVELSSGARSLLLRRGVDVVFLTAHGDFRGRLVGNLSRNAALRLRQYERVVDEQFCLHAVRDVVEAKIRHQRQVLLRSQRKLHDEEMAAVIGRMRLLAKRAVVVENLETARGLEGQAAALYFSQFDKLLRGDVFRFHGRNRRPPRDPVNACLSFGYVVLGSIIETEVCRCGLDPMLGFFHQTAYGRPSLSLDLLEEYRPLVDLLVLRTLNRRQLGTRDFDRRSERPVEETLADDALADEAGPTGGDDADEAAQGRAVGGDEVIGVYLNDTGRKIFLNELFRRLRERLFYAPREGSLELRDIVREQVYHLARVIEGKQERYVPFVPG